MLCSLRPTALRCWWGVFSSASGESFTATGATLWGIKTVGAIHTSRVISWNGGATYVAMAVGAPLGVMLNGYFGISGFAAVVILAAAVVALAFILILRIYLQQPAALPRT